MPKRKKDHEGEEDYRRRRHIGLGVLVAILVVVVLGVVVGAGVNIWAIRTTGEVVLAEIAAGLTPDADFVHMYAKADGKVYSKDDVGTEYDLTAGAGGSDSFVTWDAPAGTDPVADSSTDTVTFTTGDASLLITGTAGTDTMDFAIAADGVTEAALKAVDGAADEECLTFEATVGDFEWQACGGAGSNSFETWDTPAGTDPVADGTADTIQFLVTGSEITITGDSGADSITFDFAADAGTDITADLEEEAHNTEHASGGDDILYGQHYGTFVQSGDVSTTMAIENIRLYVEVSGTIKDVRCSVNTAPTTSVVTVDINLNGTTIFTTQGNRPSIAAAGFTDVSGAPDITSYSQGDYFTIEIDAEDSGDTAADLTCEIRVREAVFSSS